jgi:ATP/maltotriose-dependent transcriptional regulator MalT
LWGRRPEDAAAEVASVLPRLVTSEHSRSTGRLLAAGMRAQADIAERARARGTQREFEAARHGGAQLEVMLTTMRDDPFARNPQVASADADLATWHAEHARLRGQETPEDWEAAAKAWDALDRPHPTAYALWRQADALLAHRRPADASAVLRRAATLAGDLVLLQEDINALARRARIELDPTQPEPAPSDDLPYALTQRELDVLRLLARGRTNAQIGAALFMSPKTASVHVTHILR